MNYGYANDFEDGNKVYYNDIKKYKPLSKSEEKKLFKRYKFENDLSARDKLVTSNLKFVVDIAKLYKGRGLPFADLVSEGNLGLMKAIDKFEYEKDFKLISYGVWWIKAYIQDAINKKKMISSDDLPSDTDKPIDEDGDDKSNEMITDIKFIEEENESNNENVVIIDELLGILNKRETDIIKSYFGIGGDALTLDEIGLKYRLTKERVRQIKESAMRKLRSNILLLEQEELLKAR